MPMVSRFGTSLLVSLLAVPAAAAEPPKQLQGKLSWALHRVAWEAEQGGPLVAQGRRFVDGERGLVRAVAVLAPGGTPEAVAEAVALEGGRVRSVARRMGWVEVQVPPRALRPLSGHPAIARLRAPFYPAREVVSQGVASMKADAFRQRTGTDGTGVMVAVLDSGFEGVRDLIGGELPASTELTDSVTQRLGDFDNPHGTACAEIVNDVAPGAQLLLAAFDSGASWGEALDQLVDRGVRVISHSVGFPNLFPPDGNSPFDNAVDYVASRGILFVTAAGNSAESYFEGEAVDADSNGFVEFSPGTELLPITLSEDASNVVLRWDDPYGTADHDFDLFVVTSEFAANPVLDDNPAILGSSRDTQAGEGDPVEVVELELEERRELFAVVWRDPASPARAGQRLFLLSAGDVGEAFRTARGTISSPADARGALTVGAHRFDSQTVEDFSSRGPTADGRAKPDLAAPDGVATVSYDDAFFGTSASAPHVAGAAALLLSADPSLSPTELRLSLEQSTSSGGRSTAKRNDVGFGVIDLDRTPTGGPAVSPDRTLLGQSPFSGLEPFGNGESGPVLLFRFQTTRAGDLDLTLDWTSSDNDLDLVLFFGSCDAAGLGVGDCPEVAAARTSFKPETIVFREARAGEFSAVLFNRGSTTESGTLSAGLTPGSPSAASLGTPVRIERGVLRR